MRYIIALLATLPNPFIEQAQQLFAAKAKGYLLSSTSLPHITLAQFSLDDEQELSNIWLQLQQQITTIPQPHFLGVGLSRKSADLWGVSLTVARDPALVQLHHIVLEILEQHNIECISNAHEWYRPHLTLARINKPEINNFDDRILEASPFMLALGQADENGQFLRTIYSKTAYMSIV